MQLLPQHHQTSGLTDSPSKRIITDYKLDNNCTSKEAHRFQKARKKEMERKKKAKADMGKYYIAAFLLRGCPWFLSSFLFSASEFENFLTVFLFFLFLYSFFSIFSRQLSSNTQLPNKKFMQKKIMVWMKKEKGWLGKSWKREATCCKEQAKQMLAGFLPTMQRLTEKWSHWARQHLLCENNVYMYD